MEVGEASSEPDDGVFIRGVCVVIGEGCGEFGFEGCAALWVDGWGMEGFAEERAGEDGLGVRLLGVQGDGEEGGGCAEDERDGALVCHARSIPRGARRVGAYGQPRSNSLPKQRKSKMSQTPRPVEMSQSQA